MAEIVLQEWLTNLVERSKAAGAKGARSKGPKGGKWTKEEVNNSLELMFRRER